MNLYDFINPSGRDYDVADTVFDIRVTVCCIATERDSYDKFCNAIIKKVKFVRHCGGCVLEAEWTDLIKRNMEKFRTFADENWQYHFEDEDAFIYEWIREIDSYMAGSVSYDFYDELVKFVETLN